MRPSIGCSDDVKFSERFKFFVCGVGVLTMNTLATDITAIQQFDINALPREKEFGQYGFQEAVEPAQRIKELYLQIATDILPRLSTHVADNLKSDASNVIASLNEILAYGNDHQGRPRAVLIENLKTYYSTTFDNTIIPILFSHMRSLDVSQSLAKMERIVEELQTKAIEQAADLEKKRETAESILADVRKTAAEQGVSQQAACFKAEADDHAMLADWWKYGTFVMVLVIFAAAVGSLFLHKHPLLAPKTDFDSYQLIASKLILFGVLSYMLVLCSKNFMSHKHNAVVNRHRQNALTTFEALADAAADSKLRDVILTHASACIFSPQDTGYSKGAGSFSGSKSVIELIQSVTKPE